MSENPSKKSRLPPQKAMSFCLSLSASVNAFGSVDGQFDVGFYHGTEVTLSIANWPVSEVMIFLEGQVEITAVGGSPKIYGPGDALVMPKGFNGTWRQLSAIKKISVSYAGD